MESQQPNLYAEWQLSGVCTKCTRVSGYSNPEADHCQWCKHRYHCQCLQELYMESQWGDLYHVTDSALYLYQCTRVSGYSNPEADHCQWCKHRYHCQCLQELYMESQWGDLYHVTDSALYLYQCTRVSGYSNPEADHCQWCKHRYHCQCLQELYMESQWGDLYHVTDSALYLYQCTRVSGYSNPEADHCQWCKHRYHCQCLQELYMESQWGDLYHVTDSALYLYQCTRVSGYSNPEADHQPRPEP